MSKIYIVLAFVLIGLAGGLLLLPESKMNSELPPELLFKGIADQARYVSVDHVAERLINEDPSIMLIDIRTPDQSLAYSLPGAVSIPLDEIMLPDWTDYLNQTAMDVVLYSNGDVYAEQAWIICTRMGYKNLYVMSGGLNQWFADIMQPVAPAATSPSEAFDLYDFRRAARIHFGGGSIEISSGSQEPAPVKLIKREKKATAEGGC